MAGRPSKAEQWISEDGLKLLENWKRSDLTDAQIAEKIGIKPPTLIDWKKRFPQISEALKKGSEYAIADAVDALVSKFKPCTYKEEKREVWTENIGTKDKPKMVVMKQHVTTVEKTVPPDTTAIIFFLKAKAGWRDTADVKSNTTTITDAQRAELDEYFKAK